MVKIYQRTIKENASSVSDHFKPGSWICVENPNTEELENLSKNYFVDSDLLKDATDPYEVPRLEFKEGFIYIFTRVPYSEGNGKIFTMPLLIVIAQDFLMTLSQRALPFLEKFVSGKIDFYTTQKTKLLIQIFSEINNYYNHFLTDISRRARSKGVNLERIGDKDVIQFVSFEEILDDFMSALIPTSSILKNLLSGKILPLFERDKDLIEDLFLGIEQLIERCEATIKVLINIRDSHSIILTHNLNRVIKLLTALTIIMTIPMILSSFYGMNIALPFQHSAWAFWEIVGITVATGGIMFFIFSKKRWL